MNQTTTQSVQRTLVISCGRLAQAVGDRFREQLAICESPIHAIGWVDATRYEQAEDFATAVTQTLTQISPPDLAAQLAEQGWHLANPTQLDLIILADVQPEAASAVSCLLARVSSSIYRQLGIEAAGLLFWLVGEDESGVVECLTTPLKAARGTAVLGLRNEDGFRLPDEAALAEMGAALLWCLIATPLRSLPERIIEQSGEIYDEPRLFTCGLHGWSWSAEATHAQLTRQWLNDVFAHWLATSAELPEPELVAVWMQQQAITPEGLTANIAQETSRILSADKILDWQMPLPWQLVVLFEQVHQTANEQQAVLADFAERADFQLADPIFDTTDLIRGQIESLLNMQPVGGISLALHWLQTMIAECERQCELLEDKREYLEQSTAQLLHEQERLTAKIEMLLTGWPGMNPRLWVALALRPWRWPGCGWHYWQLRAYGQQLELLARQQTAVARQQLLNRLAQKGMRELAERMVHLEQQVAEIEEMLQFIAREVDASDEPAAEVAGRDHFCTHLPNPSSLYGVLIPDAQREAVYAAAAVGGLGQQVSHLDDAISEKLWRVGGERLAGVWELTAVDALTAVWQQQTAGNPLWVWEVGWSAACPLWRFDAAQLNEATRSGAIEEAILCGADAPLLNGLLPDVDESIHYLAAANKETLWLLRLRAGLSLVAPEQT